MLYINYRKLQISVIFRGNRSLINGGDDVQDFETIYSTYFSQVYRYARSLTLDEQAAEDITAETFLRAMRALPGFRGECEIRVWLCRIAKNLWLTEQKKRARLTDDPDDSLTLLEDGRDFTETVADRDTTRSLHRALHRLDEPYREVFSLRVFAELPFADIGELFGHNAHWACVTYHRARTKLLEEMEELPHG